MSRFNLTKWMDRWDQRRLYTRWSVFAFSSRGGYVDTTKPTSLPFTPPQKNMPLTPVWNPNGWRWYPVTLVGKRQLITRHMTRSHAMMEETSWSFQVIRFLTTLNERCSRFPKEFFPIWVVLNFAPYFQGLWGQVNRNSPSMFDGVFKCWESWAFHHYYNISALGDNFPKNILSTAAGSRWSET